MISQVIFNVDSALKEKAMKKAKREGIPFSVVLNMAVKEFVADRMHVGLIGDFNAKTSRDIRSAIRDIKKNGHKNLSPKFSTLADMNAWIDN